MSTHKEGRRRKWLRWKGRLRREISSYAGDRKSEARGELEELGTEPDPDAIADEEQIVRARHKDVPPPDIAEARTRLRRRR